MRHILYVTGTRADFGLMESTLKLAEADPQLTVSLCVTGMHLSDRYGGTVKEIEGSGLRIAGRIPVGLEETSGAAMARAIGTELAGMADLFQKEKPDQVLVLGDRGEQLAGALAAIHLNIPVVHIHGGERSGTVDEPVRHAISKLAHYHLVATEGSRQRLVRMGEREDCIFVTGAPGLDGLREQAHRPRQDLCRQYNLDPEQPIALVLYHSVLQEADHAAEYTQQLMDALQEDAALQKLVLMPNADAGGSAIRQVLEGYRDRPGVHLLVHLPRGDFVSWLAAADVMVGNSSSGIIEAATFGLPVINIGTRQSGRERNANVTDVPEDRDAIRKAIAEALKRGTVACENIYGDGQAGARIVARLRELDLGPDLLLKSNSY